MAASRDTDHGELTSLGFTALLDAAADAIVIINVDGQIYNENPAARLLFDYSAGELHKMNVRELMPEPDSSNHDQYISNYLESGDPKIIGIGRRVFAKKKDGTVFPIELSVGEYADGDTRYFIGIMRDLTEKEQIRTALEESEERLRVTFNDAPIGVFTIDRNGMVLSANQAASTMTGYQEERSSPAPFTSLLYESDIPGFENKLRELLEDGKTSFVLRARYIDSNDFPAHADMHCSAVNTTSGGKSQILIIQLIDRSDQIRAEQEASEFRERLARVDRISIMGEMATGIAHEINQPLTAIASYVQACRRRLNNPDIEAEKLSELLEKADAQAQRAGDIVQRIRALVQHHDDLRQIVELNKLVSEAIELATADANSRGISILSDLWDSEIEVIADSIQLQQVVLNLLRNAADATEQSLSSGNQIIISTRLQSALDLVEICVRDFGEGVPATIQDEIYEPFVTSKKQGTGMGLSISRTIVEAHGGKLWMGRTDECTDFCFSLPTAVGTS